MLGKGSYLLLFIFIILIIIPVLLVKGPFWQKKESDFLIKVYNHQQDKVEIMELDDYLRGVVAAEMPALYDLEALKAQAVAARTYSLRQIRAGRGEYQGASISTDYRYCQAWLSEKEMKERWGFLPFFYYWVRINRAVEETRGEVLLYKGKLIDAVYHANSGGMTEDARYVWGKEEPYLKSVKSPYDQEQEKNYKNTYYFGLKELCEKLQLEEKTPITGIEILKRSKSGRVIELKIGNSTLTGIEFRQSLGLSSTKFTVSLEGDILTLTVFGKGHGVGMSQDGANGLAKHGYSYREILQHYYPGTTLARIGSK